MKENVYKVKIKILRRKTLKTENDIVENEKKKTCKGTAGIKETQMRRKGSQTEERKRQKNNNLWRKKTQEMQEMKEEIKIR